MLIKIIFEKKSYLSQINPICSCKRIVTKNAYICKIRNVILSFLHFLFCFVFFVVFQAFLLVCLRTCFLSNVGVHIWVPACLEGASKCVMKGSGMLSTLLYVLDFKLYSNKVKFKFARPLCSDKGHTTSVWFKKFISLTRVRTGFQLNVCMYS